MSRNRFWLSLLVIVTLAAAITSCKTKKAVSGNQDIPGVIPYENALLWQIDGKNMQKPSYLFGTIHMIDSEDFFLPEGTEEAIDKSSQMVFEIDMAEMTDLSAQMGLLTKAFMSDNIKLSDLLSDEEYEMISEHFSDIGLPMFMLERIKPMFLTVFAGGDIDPFSMQEGSIVSYEFYFYEQSEERGMTTDGLESIEFQMSVFDSIPYEEQAQMLVDAVQMSDEDIDYLDQMVEVYKSQDINRMVEMMSEEGGIEGYENLLLVTRNKNWIPRMELIMKTSPAFFAVGAGHLGGENGVIALLRQEGYNVVPYQ